MATYGELVRKHEARVKKAIELGLEPDPKYLDKLYYYVGRAEKKGADHPKTDKDRWRNTIKTISRNINIPDLLLRAAKIK